MTRKVLAGIAQIMKQVERRPWERMDDAKLLQQRMVDDGWIVGIEIRPGKVRALIARYCDDQLCPPVEMDAFAPTEPQAIFELFCRVYGIPASE